MKSKPGYTFAKEAEDYISAKRVRCEPLMSVLDRHEVGRIDVLAVDAETYDYQILKQLDFDRFRPKLILYEHYNLTEDDKKAAAQLLSAHGYRLVNCGRLDTMAVRRG